MCVIYLFEISKISKINSETLSAAALPLTRSAASCVSWTVWRSAELLVLLTTSVLKDTKEKKTRYVLILNYSPQVNILLLVHINNITHKHTQSIKKTVIFSSFRLGVYALNSQFSYSCFQAEIKLSDMSEVSPE